MSRSAGVVENGAISNTTFFSNARPTANAVVAAKVRKIDLERALAEIPLLADSSGSTGWREWHRRAGLEYRPMHNRLVIPDSNDRVQAVIDGQGIALWDALVQNELDSGELCYLSDVALDTVGYYLVYTAPATDPRCRRRDLCRLGALAAGHSLTIFFVVIPYLKRRWRIKKSSLPILLLYFVWRLIFHVNS